MEEKWFKNNMRYSVMMMARSNTLPLKWRNFNDREDIICDLCNSAEETTVHFLLDCFKLQEVRNEFLILQMPRPENSEIIISKILLLHLSKDEIDEHYIKIVNKLWMTRKFILEHH